MAGGRGGESVMRPHGALCWCCENTLLWDVETGLYGCWNKVGINRCRGGRLRKEAAGN